MIRILTVGLLLALVPAGAIADEPPKSKPPAHTPEWTNPATGDPGVKSVAKDLQRIVVLCATDHQSPEFKRAWSAYVREHELSGDKLDRVVRQVVDEAFRHRQELGQTGDKRRVRSPNWKGEASKAMHDAAMRSVRNMK